MRKFLIAIASLIGLVVPRELYACPVCTELPDASLADHILAAEIVVLAGPALENPFRFAARRVLSGNIEKLETIPDIPFLIDSVTRRAFRSDPTNTVLLTYGPTYRDGAGRGFSSGWRRIFTMTPDRSEFLEELQSSGQIWAYGETSTPDRVSFFAEYLWHPDHVLHNVALLEIARAPYELVRPIGGRFSTSEIMRELHDLNRFAYRPATIRMLGLQTDPQALSIVRSRYAKSLKSGGLNSFEWALAGIEADKTSAIRAIGLALQDPLKTEEDRKSLIRALGVAGSSHTEFRPEIAQIYSEVLEKDHGLALQIAISTRNWGEPVLRQQFEALVALEETDLATRFILEMALAGDIAPD